MHRLASGTVRVVRAWRVLPHERRPAAYAALALFMTLFLPWYQETGLVNGKRLQTTSATLTGWGAFSFVEAAVLLVAVGILTLLFQRAEGRAFHLPGGDGWVITVAGLWTCLLIVWRIFDKQGVTTSGQFATTSGIEWGIFVALGVAAFLTYSGSRIRAAHRPEPALPGENGLGAVAQEANGPSRRPPRGPSGMPPGLGAADPSAPATAEPGPAAPRRAAGRSEGSAADPAAAGRSEGSAADPAAAGRSEGSAADPAAPQLVAADDPPTARIPSPSTPAAGASRDEQLTIPLDDRPFED
jgi:hypothetical protein